MVNIHHCGYHTHNPDRSVIYRPSGSSDYLFLYVLSPMTFQFANHTIVPAAPGACILYEPGYYQHYRSDKQFFNSYVHFTCDYSPVDEYTLKTNTLFYPTNGEEIHWLLKRVFQEYINRPAEYDNMVELYIRQLLIMISREQQQTPHIDWQQQNIHIELRSLREQMLSQCEKQWTVEQLCEILNLGKSQLYKYYKQHFNSSPKNDLLHARLQKACYLLTNDAINVKQAAYESGFQNINHFHRIFMKTYGCTPTEYRQRNLLQTGSSLH